MYLKKKFKNYDFLNSKLMFISINIAIKLKVVLIKYVVKLEFKYIY